MPQIKIEELDLTSAGSRAQENDVVYIPGLVDTTLPELYNSEGEYIGLKPFEPTFIKDINKFVTLVGSRGVSFSADQYYTDLVEETADGGYTGFDAKAIPFSRVMFLEGQEDPSYIMAKELLNAGLTIVYERINEDPSLNEVPAPENWEEVYKDYYGTIDIWKYLSTPTVPSILVKYPANSNLKEATDGITTNYKWYIRSGDDDPSDPNYTYTDVTDDIGSSASFSQDLYFRKDIDNDTIYKFNPATVDFDTTKHYFEITEDGDFKEITRKPADWGTGEYFESGTFTEVTFTGSGAELSPPFELNTYYKKTDNNVFELLNEQPADWGTGEYFEINTADFTDDVYSKPMVSGTYNDDLKNQNFVKISFYPLYEVNKYYLRTFTQLTSNTAPNDWGTANTFYTQEGNNYIVVTFTESGNEISPSYDPNTFYKVKGYEKITTTSAPEEWGCSEVICTKDGSNYPVVVFNPYNEFIEGKVFKFNVKTGKYSLVENKPADWGKKSNNVYFTVSTATDGYKPVDYIINADEEHLYYYDEEHEGFRKVAVDDPPYIYDEYDQLYKKVDYPINVSATTIEMPKNFINTFNQYTNKTTSFESYSEYQIPPTITKVYQKDDHTNIKSIYNALPIVFDTTRDNGLRDQGALNIKYITSGGYPTYEYNENSIVSQMINLAFTRGDAIAYIDHTNNPDRTVNPAHPDSLYATVAGDSTFQERGEFATMFTPYMNFVRVTTDTSEQYDATIEMSATYGYLLCLADSLKVNPAWLAVAGATRGVVPNLQSIPTKTPITNGNADQMQPRDGLSINAITEIKPYGYTIWGNRTLKNNAIAGNLTAMSFLNLRNLVCDIKKVAYSTAKSLTFEQNNDILWVNFQSKLTPTLDKMKTGYGISGYKLVRDTTSEKAQEKATLCAQIIIYPTYAVEDFHITIVLTDEEVGVEE